MDYEDYLGPETFRVPCWYCATTFTAYTDYEPCWCSLECELAYLATLTAEEAAA